MKTTLEHVCCARVPVSALAVLADLRRSREIRVRVAGDHAWVRWEAGDVAVLRRLLPVPGVELHTRRDALWYRPGAHLPSFGLPVDLDDDDDDDDEAMMPLARAVTPRPIAAREPDDGPPEPLVVGLAPESRARDASALRCSLADLGRWAEMAPTGQLNALSAAWAESDGDGDSDGLVMLLGRRLPAIAGARFWGDRLLSPLGFRPEPDLPGPALRRALGADEGAIVVLEADGFEVIPRAAFRPLTRAGVRLALAQALAHAPRGDARP